MTPEIVHTSMPKLGHVNIALANELPPGYKYPEHAVRRHAYVAHRELIDSGTPVDVHVTDYGVVSFRFTPSPDYPEAGASSGKFTPFEA